MKRYIVIPNWEKFQHKDVWKKSGGRPPWIKNYTRLLYKPEYADLSMTQRGLLHGIWLLYASSGQELDEDICRRFLITNKGESRHLLDNLKRLNDAGLISLQSRPEESREEEIRKTLEAPRDFQHVQNPRQALELLKGGNEEVA